MKTATLSLDESYLSWYFRLLMIFGMWNPYDQEQSVKKRLYSLYTIGLLIVLAFPPSLGEVLHTWKNRKNLSILSQHLTMVTAMISTFGKIVSLSQRRSELEKTSDMLNWERRQPCNRKFAIYRDEIITSAIRTSKLFSSTFIVMVIWYCTFSYGRALIYTRGSMDKLSSGPVWSLGANDSTSYWLYFLIDKITISYVAGCTTCHDIFFSVFLIHVGAQLDLLKERLESCWQTQTNPNRSNKTKNPVEALTIDDISDLKIETVCRSILEESSVDSISELHMCIQHHQTILRYSNLVQNIFGRTLLLQFGTSLSIITMVSFQIFGDQNLKGNELLESVNFLVCAIFQLFLYCWFGTGIISKSESISLSGYYTEWYDADIRFKKSLSILIQHGQIPIIFRAGYICDLSSQTFMMIISKCYSFMALLNQVYE